MKFKHENEKLDIPMIGDLPRSKLAMHENLFMHVIVDTCGPFSIIVKRKTGKRCLALVKISCKTYCMLEEHN